MKQLRPYQIKAIEAINNCLIRGVNKIALILPTGTGKTFTAVQAIKDMGRILWITHTQELITQSAKALSSEINEEVGLIKADVFDINHKVVMASAQTLHKRLDKLSPNQFDVIVADECDLFGSVSFLKSLSFFTPKLRLGLTATYYRNDNMEMTDIFDEVAYEYPLHQAVKDNYLTKPIVVKLKTNVNLDSVHTLAGEFNSKELTEKINTPARNYNIVDAYIKYGEGRQFIAFCCDVQHAMDLSEAFNEKGVNCNFVVGDKSLTTDRTGTIDKFENGEITGLTNVMVLSVGYNYDDIGCEIMACPTKSKRKFIQQIWRGMRLKSEKFLQKWKQTVIIIDVVDGTSKHKLINTDELDKDLPLEDKIFLSDEHRQKLMEAKEKRERMVDVVNRKEDELFELFPIPKIPRFKKSDKPATEPMLYRLKQWGYPIEEVAYSESQFQEIFLSQPAYKEDFDNLTAAGYDTSRGLTLMESKLCFNDLMQRDKRKKIKR